jgi:hypothetical protein
MWGRGKARACLRLGIAGSLVLVALAGWASAQDSKAPIEGGGPESSLRTTLSMKWEILAFRRAAAGALRRLSTPKCRKLFSEFKDASGRTLQDELDALGQTPASFMGSVLFADGRGERPCGNPNILALSEPGSRAIWICGEQFAHENQWGDAGLTEAVLIHEELHALGLGENPPSSTFITMRVRARCR